MTSKPTPLANPSDMMKIKQLIAEDHLGGWDKAWQNKVTPWDAGQVQPPLRDLIEQNQVPLPKSGRALVPGCGKGYDAVFIASSLGLNTLGADISATAVRSASEYLGTLPSAPAGKVEFKALDFFAFTVPEDEKFDLVYDYAFFVAIPPTMRPDWGRKMTELVKSGGYLITLMFPMDQPKDAQGPPHYVEFEHYAEALGDGWEKVFDVIPKRSLENHIGRDRLVVWLRK
ncbi:S-adenosyl-L-methionine-dependent methyltransferase [Gloeophyllum trabeum ATCC 11539]|uniref:S-adenosyl-L-methionine-dependent methyltransferase n=1 Tax=Gloeophyllum trabeum (strain ATCC 11539 / FP-39264 / Madison 617) TaxID=670483 RepID=S7RXD1_GLOTA|nr:S-adenosyl-L-methionine-dependent methyltransferase [Gloeophyllum trabeum ATCC 11539]EPQ59560.1 S-adenosyl-L-methionine-dependent methyltransferase [Gloeophyllum trabeum ATCC 11539]